MNIVVLTGGNSTERAVSFHSGRLVSEALRRRGHRVLQLDVWRGLTDREIGDDPISLFSETFDRYPPRIEAVGGDAPVGENVLRLCRLADVVFLALHGGAGENGQVQAMLDCCGVRYTGSGFRASLLSMDKPLGKLLLRHAGILTPDWCVIDRAESTEAACERVAAAVGFPCVLKPCDGGSSIGVTMVESREGLSASLREAQRAGWRMMAERRIFGRELTVGILGGHALPPIEIVPREGFYDYDNKYIAGRTEEICPAPIGEESTAKAAAITRSAFDLLGLRGYARADYIMDGEGRMWLLEINTLPGMTSTSLLPQEAQAVGIGYDELCERIARSALI
jgi:D-alanine-D-alanine ligase